MLDDGKATFCDLIDQAQGGDMPKPKLKMVHVGMFENRIVGFNRRYAAMGVNQEISALIRIWRPPLREDRTPAVQVGMVAVLEESEIDGQYRVDVVQPLSNFDGINVTELTLSRLEDNYEIAGEIEDNDTGTSSGDPGTTEGDTGTSGGDTGSTEGDTGG